MSHPKSYIGHKTLAHLSKINQLHIYTNKLDSGHKYMVSHMN
jgi:hypothetical protein